jgi:hypothetical protein
VIDVFAWISLLILAASAVAIFFIAGSLPGYIAGSRNRRVESAPDTSRSLATK